jgi:diaminopimelate decarboxylase
LRLYSLKANGLPSLTSQIRRLGFGASAVSGGELELARRAGFRPGDTALEGIGKSEGDLAAAVRLARAGTPLLWVSVESADEAAALATLVRAARGSRRSVSRATANRRRAPLRVDVLVRLNPGVQPETIRGLAVGAGESKFGVRADELAAVIDAGGGPRGPLRWRGVHLHIGSQLGAVDAWRSALRIGLAVLGLQRAALPDFDTLDAGSGFPIADEAASAPSPAHFARAAAEAIDELPTHARPARLAIEPGRSLVARCGWLLASVLHVRDRSPLQVVLDAGMTELIRPALYGASHPLIALTSLGRPIRGARADTTKMTVRFDGPVCESTDRLGEAEVPPLRRGDLVAIGLAGAYASSMASTYNGRPRAPEIAWTGKRLTLLRARSATANLP